MVAFSNEISLIGFISLLWVIDKGCQQIGVSPLVGNLLTGIVMGPALLDVVPYPDAMKLIGKIGVLLLIVDGTLSIDLEQVKKIGLRALTAAALGVAGPVGLSMLFVLVIFDRPWKTGLSTGAAIAPTSLGFSAKMLQEAKVLTTPLGQLICVAAVMDDVISLCLLSEIKALDDITAWGMIQPIVASIGSIVVGAILAITLPKYIPTLLSKLPLTGTRRRYFLVFIILGLSSLLAFLSAYAGSSDLLGAFCGAIPFSGFVDFTEAWQQSQMSPLINWGTRLFFSATIGFGVPKVETGDGGLLSAEAIWKGITLGICGLLGKMLVGMLASPFTVRNYLIFGWAMQGRGEFSFILADEAAEEDLFHKDSADHPSVIWALLICCIATPIAFKRVLGKPPPAEVETAPDGTEKESQSDSGSSSKEAKEEA
eukprot:TRINITY_DN20752_c0_g1_i1.p1 TRINITY_DN20752_c0_g1~~TRINITY_DN20752_c0_g1_i1.p1  ORF type:complete len:426 (+),score=73.66 TRINITY_DN20752_c0_g1_i1:81-1358(+)